MQICNWEYHSESFFTQIRNQAGEDECRFVRRATVYHVLTLKIKVNYFTSKNEFIWEQQIIASQDKQAVAKAVGKSNKQGRRTLFYGEKGESWEEKSRVQGANARLFLLGL